MKRFRRGLSLLMVAALTLLLLGGCAAKESPVVMVVGGENIRAREYAYFLRLNSSYADPEQGDDGVKAAKEMAANQVILMHLIFEKAAAYGITLTKEDQDQLKNNKKENIAAAGGTAAYEKALKESGMTDTLFDKISESSVLYQKLADGLYAVGGPEEPSAEEITRFFEENYATVSCILKATTDNNGNALSDDQIAKKRGEAEDLLEKIRDGADFLTLVKSEGEDPELTDTNGYQYTFTHSALTPQNAVAPELEDAAFALDVGGISGIVETENGFLIIKRLPLDQTYPEKNRSALILAMTDELFNEQIQQWMKEATVTYSKEYENITPSNVELYLK